MKINLLLDTTICARCGRSSRGTTYRTKGNGCRLCRAEYMRNYNQRPEAKEKRRAYYQNAKTANPNFMALACRGSRRYVLLRKYGVSLEQYEAMQEAQAGLCAICHKPPSGKNQLSLDHDHASGQIRELLCVKCNTLLGFANDDLALLQAAIAYVIKHQNLQSENS
jgi:hypothetical protein